ncbi:MAG: efflux RND transporter periplasmic adaptor subunit [Hyphomicrobium sp.]|jgi:RND family efflux transporter MFP subunit
MRAKFLIALVVVAGFAALAYEQGLLASLISHVAAKQEAAAEKKKVAEVPPPAVTAVRVALKNFVETVLVTGSLVPHEEILVAPEVDGLRVLEVKADEGDEVKKGDILAVLVFEQLDALLAQNDAALARSEAAIAQAKSQITESEARLAEAKASLERARPLVKDKYLSESVFDQRDAAAKTSAAQRAAADSVLRSAEAEKAQVEAQRRELLWRRGNTEVRAPADGMVSRRNARIGAIANGGAINGGEPLFRIIENGEVEVDAEVSEMHLAKLKEGQRVSVEVAGMAVVQGAVRLVSPEVMKATRLGRVRIFLGRNPSLRIGAFARGTIETAHAHNLAVPQSAVLYDDEGPSVQVIENGRVSVRRIETGLSAGNDVEVVRGVAEGDLVVAKAGTFLREGDAVRAITVDSKVSEAAP